MMFENGMGEEKREKTTPLTSLLPPLIQIIVKRIVRAVRPVVEAVAEGAGLGMERGLASERIKLTKKSRGAPWKRCDDREQERQRERISKPARETHLRHTRHIRTQVPHLRSNALMIGPPAVGVRCWVRGREVGEVAGHGALCEC